MVGIFFEEARPGELKANLIIMWREDNIIEEIVEDSNIEDAIKTVLRKRRRKRSFAGRRIPVSYTHLDVYKRQVQYGATEGLLQAEPVNIRLFSDTADVEIRNFRIYNRALTDDEELNNYMVCLLYTSRCV